MKTFEEWALENELDENWKKWLAGAALAGSLAAPIGYYAGQSSQPTSVTQNQPDHRFDRYRAIRKQQQAKVDQLRQAGRTSGNFVGGELQPDDNTLINQSVTSPDAAKFLRPVRNNKTITSQKVTSPAAAEFLK